jgi:hypothetical protein
VLEVAFSFRKGVVVPQICLWGILRLLLRQHHGPWVAFNRHILTPAVFLHSWQGGSRFSRREVTSDYFSCAFLKLNKIFFIILFFR